MAGSERGAIQDLFIGDFAPVFWSVQVFGMFIPIVLLLFKWGRKPLPLFIIANIVVLVLGFTVFFFLDSLNNEVRVTGLQRRVPALQDRSGPRLRVQP